MGPKKGTDWLCFPHQIKARGPSSLLSCLPNLAHMDRPQAQAYLKSFQDPPLGSIHFYVNKTTWKRKCYQALWLSSFLHLPVLTLHPLTRPPALPQSGYFSPWQPPMLAPARVQKAPRALSSGPSSTTSPQDSPHCWVLPGPLCSHCQTAPSSLSPKDWATAPVKGQNDASPE